MAESWRISSEARKATGKWKKSVITLAREAKNDTARARSRTFDNRNAGLWCAKCHATYNLPICSCWGVVAASHHSALEGMAYRAVLFAEGGAGFACQRCETLAAKWTCPGCGNTAPLNTSIADTEEGPSAPWCAIGCFVLAAGAVLSFVGEIIKMLNK